MSVMIVLAARLLFAGVSALPASDAAKPKMCIGSSGIDMVSRAEARTWPFAADAGMLGCRSLNGRRTVTFSPDGAFGTYAELSGNPLALFATVARHREVFAEDQTPVEIADGVRWWAHQGAALCERNRAATIRPCFNFE